MIRVEPLQEFAPNAELLLFPYSASEFQRSNSMEVLQKSEHAWAFFQGDRLLCYAGLVRMTLLDSPYLWFLLGRQVRAVDLRGFRRLITEFRGRFPHIRTVVEVGYKQGEKFAGALGFAPVEAFIEYDGRNYQFFEVR